MTGPHYFNGRILMRDHGGVRRYASEMSERLPQCTVLRPKSANHPWSARLWEQTTLARQAGDGVLISFSHSGPLRHGRHVLIVHDLLALTDPRSVSRAHGWLLRVQLPRLIAQAAKVVAISRSVADDLRRTFGVDSSRLAVVTPGVSDVFAPGDRVEARTKLGLDPQRPVVAALLDPTPRKNSACVAKLLTRLQADRPEVQVVVAGSPTASAFARRRGTRRNRIARPPGFVDIGAASDVELASMYRSSDIFVALSSGEGFGLPVVEAAACGAAVVTTPVPSIVEHSPSGARIVDGPHDGYAAVTELLDQPARRLEVVARARQDLSDLNWAHAAASLDSILHEVGRT